MFLNCGLQGLRINEFLTITEILYFEENFGEINSSWSNQNEKGTLPNWGPIGPQLQYQTLPTWGPFEPNRFTLIANLGFQLNPKLAKCPYN